ncbi:MAG: C4-type zinc ribbon domain-containing protein [Verrucomicrobiota bacterium]
MKELMQNLVRLQAIDFDESNESNTETVQAELRSKIPPQILGHYDRLVARGKKGVATVRDQVCTGCHMRLPIGVITTLMHNEDIQLCDNCGRYLYLAPVQAAPPPAEPAPASKPAKRGRKPKAAKVA